MLQGQGDTHFDFALSAAETDPDTRAGLLQSFDRLLQKYPENGQLLFRQGPAAAPGRPRRRGPGTARGACRQRTGNPLLLLRVCLLQGLQRGEEAAELLQKAWTSTRKTNACAWPTPASWSSLKRLDEAKSEFAGLVQQFPDDDDLRYFAGPGVPGG